MILLCGLLLMVGSLLAQTDSLLQYDRKPVLLKEVVVRSGLNVPAFIERVKRDTSFYKAFKNLRILAYTSLNSIQILDKKGRIKASLDSRTMQYVKNGCRWTESLQEKSSGDFYDRHHDYNYYTAELYASLFFAADTVCGESNVVGDQAFSLQGKSGLDKHKEQLKMLFFNPGKRIPGLPFIGNKVALFDDDIASLYDFEIDMDAFKGEMCYVFRIHPRANLSPSQKDRIVIDNMTTWFSIDNWQIVARQYDLRYDAGIYDFDVHMEVEMTRIGEWVVPSLLRYNGNWHLAFHKREKALFTASLFNFEEQ